jgi:hypothetical protein
MLPRRVARRDYEYKRCGTANVFCCTESKAGRHFTKVTPTRRGHEFADYLLEIAVTYPEADTIHLVLDNRRIGSITELHRQARAWNRRANRDHTII